MADIEELQARVDFLSGELHRATQTLSDAQIAAHPTHPADTVVRHQPENTRTTVRRGLTMASTPEGKVKKKIKKLLDNYEGLYYEMPVPSGYGRSGLDYQGCFCGKYFAIEAKAPGKKPTPLQEETIRRIEKAGGTTFVINDDRGVQLLDAWLTMRSVQ